MSARPTRQRIAITDELARSRAFRSAQQIHAALTEHGHRVALATVYRALQAMAAGGEVDVIRTHDAQARYRLCSSGHHHHLLCRRCERTVEVEDLGVEAWAAQVAARHGFVDIEHVVELVGTCADCRDRPRAQP